MYNTQNSAWNIDIYCKNTGHNDDDDDGDDEQSMFIVCLQ